MAIAITLLSILGYLGIGLFTARSFVEWSCVNGNVEHDDLVFGALAGAFWPFVLVCMSGYWLWRGVVRIIAPEIAQKAKRLKQAAETLDAAKELAKVANELDPEDPMHTLFFDQVEEMTKKAVELGARAGYEHLGSTEYEIGSYGDRNRQTWRILKRKAPPKTKRSMNGTEGAEAEANRIYEELRDFGQMMGRTA